MRCNRVVARLSAVLVVTIGLPIASTVLAQSYPVKPVKFLVPFAPGGATDIAARMLGQRLGEIWGQTVVIVMNFGHAGVGSQTHLAAENFLYAARIDMQHVPYKGEAPALTDLVAGQTAMATPNLSAAISFINSGKLRALAVTGRERVSQLSDVPTVAETVPGFENYGWFGLMAVAGTPKAILDKVHRDATQALDSAAMRGRFYVLGMSIVANAPEQFAHDIRAERARWGKVVAERRISPN